MKNVWKPLKKEKHALKSWKHHERFSCNIVCSNRKAFCSCQYFKRRLSTPIRCQWLKFLYIAKQYVEQLLTHAGNNSKHVDKVSGLNFTNHL